MADTIYTENIHKFKIVQINYTRSMNRCVIQTGYETQRITDFSLKTQRLQIEFLKLKNLQEY